MEHTNANNQIAVHGVIVGTPDYSHSVGQERFLRGIIRVNRTSGNSDLLPFMVSERIAPDWTLGDKDEVVLTGQIRSHKVYDSPTGKARLDIVIFVREIVRGTCIADPNEQLTMNIAEINGHICKPPVYRETPFGREICDVMVAVHRAYGKTDYIPCIVWGRNARFAGKKLNTGDSVKIKGRFQSREYTKVHADGISETRTAYEVSVFELITT